jgi:hypothetical protein
MFPRIGSQSKFDHDLTDFPLVGEHVKVDCKECHTVKEPNAEVPSFKVEKFRMRRLSQIVVLVLLTGMRVSAQSPHGDALGHRLRQVP